METRLSRVDSMKSVMIHRGPDDDGIYSDPDGRLVALGHRRLAIIDPERGRQPMTTDDGAVTVIFNGAIYNYLELRRELIERGHKMRTYSDTEVILHGYIEWGDECLDRFNGMFALAVWDRGRNRLFCARDRIGIKPFYYYHDGKTFVFASEIKSLLASGIVQAEMNTGALQDYIAFQLYLKGKTLFKNIQELEPGCALVCSLDGSATTVRVRRYWDLDYTIDETSDEDHFVDQLLFLIEDAVRLQLRSDVPLGAHLSGGLDSSTVVSMAASMLAGVTFRTFTGAFSEGPAFDETRFAKEVAQYAGVEYNEVYVPGEEFADTLPKLVYYMDQPQAGPGLYPQYHVCRLAADHVKVTLGGQGGDELFIGYARYLVAYLEKCLSGAINQTADKYKYAVSLESMAPNLPILKEYVPMLKMFFKDGLFDSPDRRYFKLIDRSDGSRRLYDPELFCGSYSSFDAFSSIFNREGLHSMINRMTYFDIKASLPALLHVEDRTSMSVSLESRVPLLDHRIAELMARIPPNIKFAGGRMKHLFKEAIKNKLPSSVLNREDKMGFPVPLNHWYKSSASDFVHDTLLSARARGRGMFDCAEVERMIDEEGAFSRVIWGLLCIELWNTIFIDGDRPV